jgi:hypothetical protein
MERMTWRRQSACQLYDSERSVGPVSVAFACISFIFFFPSPLSIYHPHISELHSISTTDVR